MNNKNIEKFNIEELKLARPFYEIAQKNLETLLDIYNSSNEIEFPFNEEKE